MWAKNLNSLQKTKIQYKSTDFCSYFLFRYSPSNDIVSLLCTITKWYSTSLYYFFITTNYNCDFWRQLFQHLLQLNSKLGHPIEAVSATFYCFTKKRSPHWPGHWPRPWDILDLWDDITTPHRTRIIERYFIRTRDSVLNNLAALLPMSHLSSVQCPGVSCTHRVRSKGRRCWLGDVIKCQASHLLARMILRKSFWKNIRIGRLVWTRWSSIFPKHQFRQVSVLLFILFFKSFWR